MSLASMAAYSSRPFRYRPISQSSRELPTRWSRASSSTWKLWATSSIPPIWSSPTMPASTGRSARRSRRSSPTRPARALTRKFSGRPTKLGYLIGQAGYFHDGHRAVDDCFALLEVLARQADGVSATAFAQLYQASQRSRVRIFAEGSPFDMKDLLKARGYRWADGSDGRPKSWWVELDEDLLDDELEYLRSEICRWPDADPPTRRLTAFDRFRI